MVHSQLKNSNYYYHFSKKCATFLLKPSQEHVTTIGNRPSNALIYFKNRASQANSVSCPLWDGK